MIFIFEYKEIENIPQFSGTTITPEIVKRKKKLEKIIKRLNDDFNDDFEKK